MGTLKWEVMSSAEAYCGMYAEFLDPNDDFVHGIETSRQIDSESWSLTLRGYEGNFVNIANGLSSMKVAADAAEEIVAWITKYGGKQ